MITAHRRQLSVTESVVLSPSASEPFCQTLSTARFAPGVIAL